LVGGLVIGIWNAGSQLLQLANRKPKFLRIQFRIGLTHIEQAFVDAGIYSEDEVKQNQSALWESLGSSGYITFTWLQQDLFFMNRDSFFSEFAELTINLKPFGDRAQKIRNLQLDCLELRGKGDAYELVLIKSENRSGWINPEGPNLTLVKLPYEFFRVLQEPGKGYKWVSGALKRQREILEQAGLEYWQDGEVPSAWDYRGKYVDLHWWTF